MTKIKERLAFEQVTLKNGMKLYYQFDPSVDFAYASLVAPVGSAHNTGNVLWGSFHFMEHMVMKRSTLYPEKNALKDRASLLGGNFGATTHSNHTFYELSAPSEYFSEMFDGLVSHFFHPLLDPADIQAERSIVINERKKISAFYPGSNEREHYLRTQWMSDIHYSLEELFGTDEILSRMDQEYLQRIHSYYVTDKSYGVISGNFDLQAIQEKLENIPLVKNISFPIPIVQPVTWVHKDFHSFDTKEVARREYCAGWAFPIDMNQSGFHQCITGVIQTMLIDYSLGTLMQWLRHEKGWVYNISARSATSRGSAFGIFLIPLNTDDEVATVRKELLSRIQKTLNDRNLLEKVKMQKKASSVFWYQTIGNRMSEAEENLRRTGRIETEQEFFKMLDSITCEQLEEYFLKNIKPNLGEILIVPKSN